MISQFYVLSPRGDTIISRDFRGDIGKGTADIFFHEVKFYKGEQNEAPPIFAIDGIHFTYLNQNGLYFVATARCNISGSFAAEVVSRIARVFKDYCGVLTEEAIRQNFVLIYELIDEMIDFGYPQDTSTELLKAYVFNEPVVVKRKDSSVLSGNILGGFKLPEINPKTIPSNAVDKPITLAQSSKKVNQIFVDIYERINVTFNSDGVVVRSEIDGTIQMKSYLSGNPELKLALNEELVIGKSLTGSNYGSIVLDDCNFHECIRTDDFETQRILRFIPPDGEFSVMNYRMTSDFRAPFRIFPFFEMPTPFKCELTIKIRADIPDNHYGANLVISLPVPKDTSSASFDMDSPTVGQSSEYVPKEHKVIWKIAKFHGVREHSLRIKIVLASSHTDSVRKEIGPISMEFEIPMYSASNLQVRFLRISEQHKSYNPYRWVRYVTRSGSYICRL
uniref:MHD domain-containing protein n=1 Tax=Spongospora subterranea TaxID=70186 RepID=A0A0H5R921_9EUKA|eukprot:CRZ10625.1 hypothetical protein [Spongospora subterranea]